MEKLFFFCRVSNLREISVKHSAYEFFNTKCGHSVITIIFFFIIILWCILHEKKKKKPWKLLCGIKALNIECYGENNIVTTLDINKDKL